MLIMLITCGVHQLNIILLIIIIVFAFLQKKNFLLKWYADNVISYENYRIKHFN